MKNYIVITTVLLAIFLFACSETPQQQQTTPSATMKKYIDAFDRRDLAAAKQTFSKGTMNMYQDLAQKRGKTAHEIIKAQFDTPLFGELRSQVETVNEKIEGDTAVVEIKSRGKENEKIPLVREDGEWKLAFNQYMQTVIKKMTEDMNKPPTNPANN